MNYEGLFTNAFKKDLKAIKKKHPDNLNKIVDSIENKILHTPFSEDVKQLTCFNYYRFRVGKYRIIFDFEDDNKLLFLAVDIRSSIYEKLRERFNKC